MPMWRRQPTGEFLIPVLVRCLWGRVGSTLLMQLLGTSEAISFNRDYPCEDRVLSSLLHVLQPFAGEPRMPNGWWMDDPEHLWWMDPAWMHVQPSRDPLPFAPPALDRQGFHGRAVRAVWQAYTATERAQRGPVVRYYAEKYGEHAEVLAEVGIPVRFVNLIRDPRDIWLSIQAFDEKRGAYGFGRREGQPEEEYLVSFLQAVRRRLDVMQDAGGPDVLEVRYEHLVGNLAAQARRLGGWLGVDLDPDRVIANRHRFRHHMTSPSPSRSVGRWRSELTPAEAEAFDAVLGDHLARLRYDVGVAGVVVDASPV